MTVVYEKLAGSFWVASFEWMVERWCVVMITELISYLMLVRFIFHDGKTPPGKKDPEIEVIENYISETQTHV